MNINKSVRPISPEERIILVSLSRLRGFGPITFKKLYKKYQSVSKIYKNIDEWKDTSLDNKYLRLNKTQFIEESLGFIKQLSQSNINYTTLLDKSFPPLLREIYDPPIVLYYKGSLGLKGMRNCIAVVGTRKCSAYGLEVTNKLVEGLVSSGLIIVSGMAFGIDKGAHEAAMKNKGNTIAVLPAGVNKPLPTSNRSIYNKILNNGAVISEESLQGEINTGSFPRRNRIISGLSIGVIVVEAPKKSGALITARLALEQGREVFAVPSNIFTKSGEGCNVLIKDGVAKLTIGIEDILEEFGFERVAGTDENKKSYSREEEKIIQYLIRQPSTIDDLASALEFDIKSLLNIITVMEIEKKVAKRFDNRYVILN